MEYHAGTILCHDLAFLGGLRHLNRIVTLNSSLQRAPPPRLRTGWWSGCCLPRPPRRTNVDHPSTQGTQAVHPRAMTPGHELTLLRLAPAFRIRSVDDVEMRRSGGKNMKCMATPSHI
ncbi:hypothetical protein EVAR_9155_1 [Eumeta japonica]|uniref:Uncharacterized protein n=1 Tax=Eumeta variegata TaxID=151549 RepID=A0A4C1TWA4_EUMVA|nr:hypothetical protein EVAR_9155_1 [Eumeta japonica]